MGWIALDYAVFVVACTAAVGALSWWLRRHPGRGRVPVSAWLLIGSVVAFGWSFTEWAGREERQRMESMVQGFAPTFALEMSRLGHANVGLDTPPNDRTYLRLIESQIRWLAVNPRIADVYTFRRLDDGTVVLVVDSETDYDGDGRYVGEREARTAIGEVYEQSYPALERAFAGTPCFDDEIVRDRWGTWVSAFHPMYDDEGNVEAVLGVDFPAEEWLASIAAARWRVIGYVAALCGVLAAAAVIVTRIRDELDQRLRMQSELVRARDEAAAAAAARGAFLANMSHEIRTPMTAILGYADLMDDPSIDQAGRDEAVRVIRRNGRHLLAVINDILDLSKIEAGRLEVEPGDCEPVRIVEEVCSLLRVRAVEKGLDLEWSMGGPAPRRIRTDARRLKQVMLNLVGNAVKFTERGSVRVVVSMGGDAESGRVLRFRITDTGIGIGPDKIASLFQPFMQADETMSRRFGGTGLGLAVSNRLVEMLGGSIEVRSEPGVGSEFTLALPVSEEEASDLISSPDELFEAQGSERQDTSVDRVHLRARVLLAEDGEDNRRLILHHLTRAGADVETVSNGRAAVESAVAAVNDARPFDVILMDMQMPVMDGYAASRELRRVGYALPIVALTAHAMAEDRSRCLAAGCDDYVSKPIDRAELLRTCARWAGRQGHRAAA
ncbi:MAG TPA: ATP-binding protein [Phycisphaerales bacterium]|nr:ATP-binding protein [Phycisphaerales bacterium]